MNTDAIRNGQGERLDATFHPAKRSDALVIFGHGVTGDKDRPLLVAFAEGLVRCGWPCLRISFSGNGRSEGRFEDSCITKEVADLKAVLSAIPEGVRVAYAGHSMGGAVGVIAAAADPRIRVLISLAGMTHTAEFVQREFGDVVPDDGCMWDEEACPLSKVYVDDLENIHSTLPAAAQVSQPWLLIHGGEDDVVPVRDSKDALDAATSVKAWLKIPGAGHSFGPESYPLLVEAMDRWLEEHLIA